MPRSRPCAAHRPDGQAPLQQKIDGAKLALFTAAMSPLLLDAAPAEAVNNLVSGSLCAGNSCPKQQNG